MRTALAVMVLALVVALIISGSVSAQGTLTFTSTADFDAGTKSQPSPADGNYQVDTTTDNLGIATGSFELTSLKGDSFTLADADADTFKWNLHGSGVCESVVRSIASGLLNEDIECLAGGDRGVYSAVSITGDWDTRIKLDKTIDTGTTNQWWFAMFSGAASFCAGLEDGLLYAIVDANIGAYTCINSVILQVGSNTAVPSDPVWMRITRATNTFTFYYSTDGTAWTQDEQTISALIPNPLFAYVEVFADTAAEPTGADWDDFNLAAGTLATGGFRTGGSWSSAVQTDPGEVVSEITLTYSGVSVSNYITATSIVHGVSGATLFVDDTDLTSGTSQTYTVPEVDAASWLVRVNLTSGGADTPNVQAVAVTTVIPSPYCLPPIVSQLLGPIVIVLIGVGLTLLLITVVLNFREELDVREIIFLILAIIVTVAIIPTIVLVLASGPC